jgi:hypothetical protein
MNANDYLDTADSTSPVITVSPSYIAPVKGPDPRQAKFLDAFTSRDQTTTNTATNDSFNRFDTSTKTMEFGDTTLSVGAPAGGVSEYLPLILAGGIIMAGLLAFR